MVDPSQSTNRKLRRRFANTIEDFVAGFKSQTAAAQSELVQFGNRLITGLIQKARGLGGLRDSLLVGAGGLYVAGYLSWAAYAWSNGLGHLPAVDAQYFIAGVVPLLVGMLSFGLLAAVVALRRWSLQDPTPLRRRAALLTGKIAGASLILGVLLLLLPFVPERGAMGALIFALMAVGGVGLYLTAIFEGAAGSAFLKAVAVILLFFYAVLVSLALVMFYLKYAFPNLPQELGGPGARCVEADLQRDRLSTVTLAGLAADPRDVAASEGAAPVLRSRPVDLIFDSGSFTLVRVRAANHSAKTYYRLASGTVLATVPCSNHE